MTAAVDVFVEALPPRLALEYGVEAEAAGFRAAWFPEITFGDAFGPATAVATRSDRLELGTGVVGIWSRSPVTMALQAAALHDLSEGRLLLGLGVQARGYVEGWHGRAYERPIRAMREYVEIVRRILAGELVTYEGEIFSVHGFQLHLPLQERPPRLYVAAIGPQMLRLAGEIADGVLGYCWSLEYVRDVVLPELRAGAARAGRSLDDFDVACGFPTIVTNDTSGLELVKGQALMFATATSSSPFYPASFAAAGFGDDVRAIQERLASGDVDGALALVTDELADVVTIAGSAEHVRERVAAYAEAGVDTIALNPSPPGIWFPLYQGHFPENARPPEFSFPAYLGVIDDTLRLIGGG